MAMKTAAGGRKVLSHSGSDVAYAVGDYEEYRSVYGYPKRYVMIHKVMPGEALSRSNIIGRVKEERVLGPDGNVVSVCFYTREDQWKRPGQARFFNSPEALLIACGMVPIVGMNATRETSDHALKVQQTAPAATVSKLPLELQGRITHGNILMLPKPRAQALLHAPGVKATTQLLLEGPKQASRSSKRKTAVKKIKRPAKPKKKAKLVKKRRR